MKVVIYIRTSTEDQTPELQLKSCKSINKYGDYEIFKEQQSAWKDNLDKRESFGNLINLIKQRKVNHLIVWDVDRIYRNRKKLIAFFKLCKIYGCKIHSYRQQFFETLHTMPEPFNEVMFDFMLQMMGWFAEDESNKKSQRTKLAIVREKGKPTMSYKGRKWGRKAISPKIKEKVLDLEKEGKSIREIASEVIYYDKNKNKKLLSKSIVHKIIQENKGKN
jgi:DNA invertase Pin-like site-specific DNA recombinase